MTNIAGTTRVHRPVSKLEPTANRCYHLASGYFSVSCASTAKQFKLVDDLQLKAGMGVIPISALADFSAGELKQLKRGENALRSQALESFVFDGSCGHIGVRGKASMKKRKYKIKVSSCVLATIFLVFNVVFMIHEANGLFRTFFFFADSSKSQHERFVGNRCLSSR